ncbi:MAG: hypothetical protein KatS3mg108_1424 [Isosphaeraceae bacterium]|jgi:hypothetical protein|nr:MAG: hypothetical protein KatS3mg108_1424 [Isosphaeraceae bacterium]
MKTSDPHRRGFRPAAETLETRQVLSAGAGNTIAIMPGAIRAPGVVEQIEFKVGRDSFSAPPGRAVLLGVDVVPTTTSTAQPTVASIRDSAGNPVQAKTYATAKPIQFQGKPITPAPIVRFDLGRRNAAPRTFKVHVAGENNSVGSFLTGFYLVGDVNGDGKVQRKDLNLVRKALNSKVGDPNYVFDADANRDGRITPQDLRLAQQNLGVRTTILPLVTADLDPDTDSGLQDRITSHSVVRLTGVASAHATISYKETDNKTEPVQVQADASGRYTVSIALAPGTNRFQVTSQDAFGQEISGTIAPIVLKADA